MYLLNLNFSISMHSPAHVKALPSAILATTFLEVFFRVKRKKSFCHSLLPFSTSYPSTLPSFSCKTQIAAPPWGHLIFLCPKGTAASFKVERLALSQMLHTPILVSFNNIISGTIKVLKRFVK